MRSRWTVLLAGLALVVGAGLLVFRHTSSAAAPAAPTAATSEASAPGAARPAVAPGPRVAAPGPGMSAPERQQLAAYFRGRYGPRLASAHLQLRMLEKLMRTFQERFPERWEAELLAFLREAFPERAAELEANLRRWLAYRRWMEDNEGALTQLGAAERRANLWDERKRLWGEEAAREIWAAELQHQQVVDALAAIDARAEATLPQRLADYRERLSDVYGEGTDAFLERHRQEAMDLFLELGSVQRELGAMQPEQRAQSLRDIREGMGLDAEALGRWEALDRTRDARWEAGARYMAERQALTRQYSGGQLESRLAELRQRTFGAEADTIAAEEESGLFRFARPRVWGRN